MQTASCPHRLVSGRLPLLAALLLLMFALRSPGQLWRGRGALPPPRPLVAHQLRKPAVLAPKRYRIAPRHILVKLHPQANPQRFLLAARLLGLQPNGFVYGTRWLRMTLQLGRNPRQVAAAARSLPGVLLAAADPLVQINDTIPCDPFCRDDDDPSVEDCDPSEDPDCPPEALVDQWGHFQVGVPAAWDVERGDPSVVIAIIDSGIDVDHDDLYGNIWNNPDDPQDGVDNDGNGFVDDVHGADFCGDNVGDPVFDDPAAADPNPDLPQGGYWDFGEQYLPFEVAWIGDPAVGDAVDNDGDGFAIDLGVFHGTFVAGIAAAMADNVNPQTGECEGIAGAAWYGSLMAVRVINAEGWGFGSDAASAIVYAADQGADIINASWGIPLDPNDPEVIAEIQVIKEAVDYAVAQGVIVVAAAGNSGNPGTGVNGLDFPGAMANTLSVGASNWLDQRSEFSSTALWGEIPDNGIDDDGNGWVDDVLDVVAPGELIWSTYVMSGYDALLFLVLDPESPIEPGWPSYLLSDGTSFSTPLVAGCVALILSRYPNATLSDVRQILRSKALDLIDPNNAGQNLPGYDPYSGFGLLQMQDVFTDPRPVNASLVPENATTPAGSPQTFVASYTDPDGWQDIGYTAIMVLGSTLRARYVPTTHRLYLLDDSGTRWLGGYPPGSNAAIRNRQGVLDCRATTVQGAGTTLTVNWTFIPDGYWAEEGPQRLYLLVEDRAGHQDGWEHMGVWRIIPTSGSFQTGGMRVQPSAAHDLAVTGVQIAPGQPEAGQTMTVHVGLANFGRSAERRLRFHLFVGNHLWFTETVPYLGPGSTLIGTYNLTAYPPPGIYPLTAEILPVPLESVTTNNRAEVSVAVR